MRRLWPVVVLLLGVRAAAQTPGAGAAGRPIDLEEAYRLSLKRSETIAQRAESVAEALARVDELRAAILPHLSLVGTQTYQESPNVTGGISTINNTSIPQAQLTLTQPLFSGFREFLAFKAGKKQAESAALDEKRAESLLYQDVAQAYLDLLRLQDEIDIRRSIIKATEDRIKQLEAWIRIGRSRESEALAARSLLAQTEALVEIARGQERISQEVLRFLTGLEEEHFLPQPMAVPALEPLEPFLARARSRSDVLARARDLESARLITSVNRRQRWPTIGFTGDYYLKRVGFNQNVHWDAIFGLTLPLFDSGLISAQVREAQAGERSSAQGLSLAARTAEREARSAYRGLESTLAAVGALSKAAELAEANVKAQAEDYRLSRVSNLEVLDSLNTLESTKINLNLNQQQAVLSRIQLEVAAGGPPPSGELR